MPVALGGVICGCAAHAAPGALPEPIFRWARILAIVASGWLRGVVSPGVAIPCGAESCGVICGAESCGVIPCDAESCRCGLGTHAGDTSS